jgi:competence protein ComEC
MRFDTGERVVAPFLWNRGIRALALAVTTHGDADHAGGMAFIRRAFPIRESWSADSPPVAGRRLGVARLQAIAAPAGAGAPGRPANERSLVLRIDYGMASFLLASDIGTETEDRLLAAGAPVAATVLKVAHHGSRGSSGPAFLAAVAPRHAVISVGARNSYGHPTPQALARLAAAGAGISRTDRDGAVLFETDGSTLTVGGWATGARERFCLDPEGQC